MGSIFNKDQPALFLGIAEYFDSSGAPFPYGSVDLYQLSQHQAHIIYPGMIQSSVWIVLLSNEFIEGCDFSKWQMRITDEENVELATINFEDLSHTDESGSQADTDML